MKASLRCSIKAMISHTCCVGKYNEIWCNVIDVAPGKICGRFEVMFNHFTCTCFRSQIHHLLNRCYCRPPGSSLRLTMKWARAAQRERLRRTGRGKTRCKCSNCDFRDDAPFVQWLECLHRVKPHIHYLLGRTLAPDAAVDWAPRSSRPANLSSCFSVSA